MASRRRKVYRGRRSKYNINSLCWNVIPGNQWSLIGNALIACNKALVQSSTVGGTRKVKNFQINMTTSEPDEEMVIESARCFRAMRQTIKPKEAQNSKKSIKMTTPSNSVL